jgi:hypothetical protein
VFPALIVLIGLIVAAPALLVADGLSSYGPVAAIAASGLAIAARSIRPGEASHFAALISPVIWVLAIPAVWLVAQVLPLQQVGLSHPIWASAGTALGQSLNGSISVDPGATLISLLRFLSLAAILLLSAAVTIDRARAEWVLLALTAATTLIAVVFIVHQVAGLAFPNDAKPAALDCALFGLIFAATSAVRIFERYETRHLKGSTSTRSLALKLGACLACFAVSGIAIGLGASGPILFTASYGCIAFAAVVINRRLGLGPWGYSGIIAAGLAIAIMLIVTRPESRFHDFTLAFAGGTPTSLISVTERILANRAWLGNGAGTFAALLPIYQDAQDVITDPNAPTSASALIIEFGRPALLVAMAIAIGSIAFFFRGALRRGRDSFYSTAAGSCALVFTLLLFVNAGGLSTAFLIIAAAAFGLGLAQIQSRTLQ